MLVSLVLIIVAGFLCLNLIYSIWLFGQVQAKPSMYVEMFLFIFLFPIWLIVLIADSVRLSQKRKQIRNVLDNFEAEWEEPFPEVLEEE